MRTDKVNKEREERRLVWAKLLKKANEEEQRGHQEEKYKSINEGSSAILVKDASLEEMDGDFIVWLRNEGFRPWQYNKGYLCGWIWVNLNNKLYARGIPGICVASHVGNHAVTADEFRTIWAIYKKYEGLDPLIMEEGGVIDKDHEERKLKDKKLLNRADWEKERDRLKEKYKENMFAMNLILKWEEDPNTDWEKAEEVLDF